MDKKMPEKNLKQVLDDKIWRTKGARFNAFRRLSKKQDIFTFVTAASSIHLLAISIVQLADFFKISESQSTLLNLTSILLSIIILAYSLIEGGKSHGIKAERHHLCGIELDKIYNDLIFSKDNEQEHQRISEEYNNSIEKYMLNHETIDDEYFMLQHLHQFIRLKEKGKWEHFKISVIYQYFDIIKAAFFILVPVAITIFIFLIKICTPS